MSFVLEKCLKNEFWYCFYIYIKAQKQFVII